MSKVILESMYAPKLFKVQRMKIFINYYVVNVCSNAYSSILTPM